VFSGPTALSSNIPPRGSNPRWAMIVIDLDEGGRLCEKPLRFRVADMAPFAQPRYLATAGASLGSDADDRSATGGHRGVMAVRARSGKTGRTIEVSTMPPQSLQGCLDACDALDENQLRRLLEYGRTWPRGQVRSTRSP